MGSTYVLGQMMVAAGAPALRESLHQMAATIAPDARAAGGG
ncbi:hypothetical protein [Dietzia sp. SLG310A2-38A2]|nr:hypothetical protein [Dietzia sp. SLG310A2-38A2]